MEQAEFDRFADEYYTQHASNIAVTGETPEYFSEYKIIDFARELREAGLVSPAIVDFGSGIGNSIPYFRKHVSDVRLTCADVSPRSLELSRGRYPGPESYIQIEQDRVPVGDNSFDAAFSACVFHHIPHEEHDLWLKELHRVVRPGGMLAIFEHNPLNPLTVRAVNTCPFDENARLLTARKLSKECAQAGWKDISVKYRIFFPHRLAFLRPAERHLTRLPLGAQYYVTARR